MTDRKDISPAPSPGLLPRLFLTFAKIGAFTFGGGWAMISIIEREVVDRYHWLDRQDFTDLLAVAQSFPGILAVNISVVVGDKLRGLPGAICAALGTITPCFLIILMIAIFLTPDLIMNNAVLSAIFRGIRPAVVALIIAPVVTTWRSSRLSLRLLWVPVIVGLLIWSKWPVVSNPILYIILGGFVGWWTKGRKPAQAQEGHDR